MSEGDMDWFFPPLGGGEENGLNDAGIETFKPTERLPREVVQNVLDNRRKKGETGEFVGPAEVEFSLIDVPADEIPGIERFRNLFEACRDHVLSAYKDEDGAGNEADFFERGMKLLSAEAVPCLRIRDRNTTGLEGSDSERNSGFYRLVRGQGYSALQGESCAGTYGIGQRAPFAHSDLRMIIYGSRSAAGTEIFAAKSILASLPDPARDGKLTQNIGWWCIPTDENWESQRDPGKVPARYRREDVGTDLWVVGYSRKEWKQRIRWSLLEHFFAAIMEGQLLIRLVGRDGAEEEISKGNLEDVLVKACDESARKGGVHKRLTATLHYFHALQDPHNGKPFVKHIPDLGEVEFYVKLDEGAPDRYCTMRSPRIYVEDFGSRRLRGYAGVVLCADKDGNRFLARMEDPAHVRWHEDELRGASDSLVERAREARLELGRFVGSILESLRADGAPEVQEIPDLGRYLPLDAGEAGQKKPGVATEETGAHVSEESGHIVIPDQPKPVKGKLRLQPLSGVRISVTGAGGKKKGGRGTRKRSNRKGGRRRQGGGGKKGATLTNKAVDLRSYMLSPGVYSITLRAAADVQGDAVLRAVGEDQTYGLDLESVRDAVSGATLQTKGNVIKGLKLKGGSKTTLTAVFVEKEPLCVKLGS